MRLCSGRLQAAMWSCSSCWEKFWCIWAASWASIVFPRALFKSTSTTQGQNLWAGLASWEQRFCASNAMEKSSILTVKQSKACFFIQMFASDKTKSLKKVVHKVREVITYLSTVLKTRAEQTCQGSCWPAAWQVQPCCCFPLRKREQLVWEPEKWKHHRWRQFLWTALALKAFLSTDACGKYCRVIRVRFFYPCFSVSLFALSSYVNIRIKRPVSPAVPLLLCEMIISRVVCCYDPNQWYQCWADEQHALLPQLWRVNTFLISGWFSSPEMALFTAAVMCCHAISTPFFKFGISVFTNRCRLTVGACVLGYEACEHADLFKLTVFVT